MSAAIRPGFADPVFDAQRTFRAVLEAMARPGSLQDAGVGLVPPAGLEPATCALAVALLDADTPLWLSPSLRTETIVGHLRFHCGCPVVDAPPAAAFALVGAPDSPPLSAFSAGDDRYPDRSATLFWQLSDLTGGAEVIVAGPGVDGTRTIAPRGLGEGFWDRWAANHALYPRGIDLVLAAGTMLLGLPRSVAARLAG